MYAINSSVTRKIIGIGMIVYDELGFGFREKIYTKALMAECKQNDLLIEMEKPVDVYYKNILLEKDYIDLVINSEIIIELKTRQRIEMNHIKQTRQYLKAANMETGFIFNFGPRNFEFRRIFKPV